MDAAITATDLAKNYPGPVRALDGLSFSVASGSIFALLGPNGAGKSTAIKILTTLSRPDTGTARVAGLDVLRQPERVRHAIGCVAQKSGVDPESTGRENLRLQGQLYGLRGAELNRRVDEMLERFNLTKSAGFLARTFSGGMKRKLDIAMGLINRPVVLFLDEPTTGLDPESRSDLWYHIASLASAGLTVLLTTHYLEEADRLARRVAIIDRGRVVVEGTPDQLKAELRGDSVRVELAEAPAEEAVRRALAHLGEIHEINIEGTWLHARAAQGARAVPLVLSALESAGIHAESVKIARPSLDDVYLRHTGRTFQQAEGGTR